MEKNEEQQTQRPETPGKKERPKTDAFKQLRQAVGKKVREQSEVIAKSLVDSTIAGNSNNARLVVSLVDKRKKKKVETKSKRGESLALNLAAEPEWDDEVDGRPSLKKGSDTDEPR